MTTRETIREAVAVAVGACAQGDRYATGYADGAAMALAGFDDIADSLQGLARGLEDAQALRATTPAGTAESDYLRGQLDAYAAFAAHLRGLLG